MAKEELERREGLLEVRRRNVDSLLENLKEKCAFLFILSIFFL
jgi:hypothetical protein